MNKRGIFLALIWLSAFRLMAQIGVPCTGLGQTPSSAFPVCGTSKFKQATVPICGVMAIPVPGCDTSRGAYLDTNPYWYKFTCFKSGTLGFLITPNNLGDDYDWQLFDITGHNPDDVFTNSRLFVVGNWSGTYGLTGASATAVGNVQCASYPPDGVPTFSRWPYLIMGHIYLLLVSHYTQSQSGYSLSFAGGSAVITDTLHPHLKGLTVSCDGTGLLVRLNKRMACRSLAADGTDFVLANGAAVVQAAKGYGCDAGFDLDSVQLTLDKALAPGNYKLLIQTGSDNNTLLDNCGTPIPSGEEIDFAVTPLQPTPLDSLNPVGCSPNRLRLVFSRGIQCSTIALDGSDFVISGNTPVTITGASGACNGSGISNSIDISLSAPIQSAGNYQLKLVNGTDGNTIIDECGQQTLAGSTLNFTTADTVSAKIDYAIHEGCSNDTVLLNNKGGASINQWLWTYDTAAYSDLPTETVIYQVFGDKTFHLMVSNGVCSDTASVVVSLNNFMEASFETQDMICPSDDATFSNQSIGQIVSWNWNFGDGFTDFNQTPQGHAFPKNPLKDVIYPVTLIVTDSLGCQDTATRQVRKLHSCYIAVPNAFTPNGDGINDYLYPLNAFKAIDLEFRVYNRYGNLVFESNDWSRKWDGRLNGKPQDAGTFVWTLRYQDRDTGKRYFTKGTSVLIR